MSQEDASGSQNDAFALGNRATQEFALVPHNCVACGYWTATEVIRVRRGWILQCTYCGSRLHGRGNDRAFHQVIDAINRFKNQALAKFPEFSRLSLRGGHLTYPPSNTGVRDL